METPRFKGHLPLELTSGAVTCLQKTDVFSVYRCQPQRRKPIVPEDSFWPAIVSTDLLTNMWPRKDSDAGKDWRRKEKGTTEGELVGMASLTQWTWVWVNSGSWWWTGRPGVLWFMGRKESDTAERLNWTELMIFFPIKYYHPKIFHLQHCVVLVI